jgi:predicted nucleic acid-binding protein
MLPADAREIVRLYSAWPVVTLDEVAILTAGELQVRRSIAFWDALIVAAAQLAGADEILTEDLSHGEVVEGVRIVNPFREVAPGPA